MGTIGNFSNKKEVILALLKVSKKLYIDFYPPTKQGLNNRKKMYEEERWINVKIKGNKIISEGGLESASLSKKDIIEIIKSIRAKVKFYPFHKFSIMVEITK